LYVLEPSLLMSQKETVPSMNSRKHYLNSREPSNWVSRFAPLIREGGPILDVAAGGGRHGRFFLERGHPVTLLDQETEALQDLSSHPHASIVQKNLEDGSDWPLKDQFAAVLVVNYLHRPLTDHLLDALETGGVLIYETFARGNEAFGRPRNPDHLLKSGELLQMVSGRMQVIAYEHGIRENSPLPGVIQRVCAVKNLDLSSREDGDPPNCSLELK